MKAIVVDPTNLHAADRSILLQVYRYNVAAVEQWGMPPGTPFLPAPTRQKRAKALAAVGLLKPGKTDLQPNPEGWDSYTITQEGIDAYNAAMRTAGVKGGGHGS